MHSSINGGKAKENAVLKIQVKIHSGHLTVHTDAKVKPVIRRLYCRQINLFLMHCQKYLRPIRQAKQGSLLPLPDRLSSLWQPVNALLAAVGATDAATAEPVSFGSLLFSILKPPCRRVLTHLPPPAAGHINHFRRYLQPAEDG